MRPLRRAGLALSSAMLLHAACAHGPPERECGSLSRYQERCSEALARGNLDAAEASCGLALELQPRSADLWALQGLIALQRQDTRKAKRHFLRALEYDADHAQARARLAAIGLEEGAASPAP